MHGSTKSYSIGGHLIRVALCHPWTFKALTAEQKTLVETLRSGGDLGIRPVPADRWEELPENESAMGKSQMTREKWEAMGEAERDAFRHDLDMLQYAPFEVETAGEPLFSLTVGGEEPAWLAAALQQEPVVGSRLEIYRLLVDLLSAELAYAGWRRGVACGGQELASDKAVGNLKEPVFSHLRNAEQSVTL